MSERRLGMDFVGILKEAWETTWRHRALWVLGLFAAGSGGVSIVNWQMDASDFQNRQHPSDWKGLELHPQDVDRIRDQLADFFNSGTVVEWLFWLIIAIGVLLLIGLVLAVLSVAAKGGLVHQTNEALAGREVSARAGWRIGFKYWGRVFFVGLLLVLPQVLVAAIAVGVLAFVAATFFALSDAGPGALGLLAVLPFAALLAVGLGVLMGMLREVALRHAVLDDSGALDGVKAAWADLWGKRGVAGMWLVMLLVGIGSGVAAGIVMIPLVITVGLITGAAVLAGGTAALWILVPLVLLVIAAAMLLKAVYQTFANAAWTSFYRRMIAATPGPEVADAA